MAKYNGWTNHQTWLYSIHFLDNQDIEESSKNCKSYYELGQALKSELEELVQSQKIGISFLTDILSSSINQINFTEIAESADDDDSFFKDDDDSDYE